MKLDPTQFFDLTVILGTDYPGYYVDRDFRVYSTRSSKYPTIIVGTNVNMSGVRRYKFSRSNSSLPVLSMRSDELVGRLMKSVAFRDYRSRGHESFINSVMKEKKPVEKKTRSDYIIGSVRQDGSLSFAEKPVPHDSDFSAKQEAERLAKLNPGKEFIVAQIIGRVKVMEVVWDWSAE